jgi:membrane peptidoglycan carboxypeptidase
MKRTQRINRITRRRPPRKSKFWPIVLVIAALGLLLQLVLVGAVVTASGAGVTSYYNTVSAEGLKKLSHTTRPQDIQPTRILDRHGQLLLEINDPTRGLYQYEPLSKMPRYMKDSIVASEDNNFYTNQGVDPNGIARALQGALHGHITSGGSTITQQLVKNLVLNNSYNVQRKFQEIVIARAMSQPGTGWTKDKILNLYLNTVYFGHQATGVEAAARVYFGKDIWQLDLAQCALLAGLVQAPSLYDPIANGPTDALRRLRSHVLPNLVKYNYISQTQANAAYAEAKTFTFNAPPWNLPATTSVAPYWTDWIAKLLTYGGSNDKDIHTDPALAAIVAQAGGLSAGLTITTTLDLKLYQHTQQVMQQQLVNLGGNNVQDAAVVQIDPKTSQCINMVGGVNYSKQGSFFNMAAIPRQPGSSFKVYTYLTAFKQGWSPASMILDQPKSWLDPTTANPNNQYTPSNYDLSFHGAVSVRMALSNSYNVPAVKTIDAVGPANVVKTAEDMGVTSLAQNPDVLNGRPPLSLTLGSEAVPLWQMAQGYNTIANGGVYRPMDSVLAIADANGNTLYTYKTPPGARVLAPQYAYMMESVMKDNSARVAAFNTGSALQLGPDTQFPTNVPTAVKTGTTQDFRDNLTIGFTPNLLTATWVGNPDNTKMNQIEGVTGAGPIWHETMEWTLKDLNLPIENFTIPPGIALVRVSSGSSGATPYLPYLADQYTRWPIVDVFPIGAIPHTYDPGTEDSLAEYRVLGQSFSVDGGAYDAAFQGDVSLSPAAIMNVGQNAGGVTGGAPGAAPAPGTTGTGTPGSSITVPYNPGSHANVCGGGFYTYTPVYTNGAVSGYSVHCA